MSNPTDIANRFNYHPANDERAQQHDIVRRECKLLADMLDEGLPDGREKALAITNLEQAMFWANAAIARK